MIVILALASLAAPQCPSEDAFVGNQTCFNAVQLTSGLQTGLVSLTDDWWRVEAQSGERVDLTASFDGTLANIDLVLFAPDCVTAIATSNSLANTETVSAVNQSPLPVSFYLQVVPDASACGDYSLDVQVALDPCFGASDDLLEDNDDCATAALLSSSPESGLMLVSGDDDWFTIDVPAGHQLDLNVLFTHGPTDIDAELFDATCSSVLGISQSGDDNESLQWINTEPLPAQVNLRVFLFDGACGMYDLSWSTAEAPCLSLSDDHLEDNDGCFVAYSPLFGTQGGLFVSKTDADWFEFVVPPAGVLSVDALFSHSSADIDLRLYLDCDDVPSGSFHLWASSTSDNENLTWMNPGFAFETVMVQVFVWPGSTGDCNGYDLVANLVVAPIGTNYCTATPNSTGAPALMEAFGSTSVATNSLALRAAPVPAAQFGVFFYGPGQAAIPFGNGTRCVAAAGVGVFRLPLINSGPGGEFFYQFDLTAPGDPAGQITAGSTWNFQGW